MDGTVRRTGQRRGLAPPAPKDLRPQATPGADNDSAHQWHPNPLLLGQIALFWSSPGLIGTRLRPCFDAERVE
jgi:hypothetical protein